MNGPRPSVLALALAVLVNGDASAASRGQESVPAILVAASEGDHDVVRRILDDGIDPNVTNGAGQTALMMAAGGGHSDVVKLLLDRGADPTLWDQDEDTALGAYAAANGHADIVEVLLKAGASALVANRDGVNPLMFAALYGHPDAQRLLEEAMLPLAAAQSLTDLAQALSKMGREVDAERVAHRATVLKESVLGPEVNEQNDGPPALWMVAGPNGRCLDLGYHRLAICVGVGSCTFTRSGTVRVTWMGVGTDPREIVERFVREARRLDADGVFDVRVELTPSLGRNRISRIDADAISFDDARCSAMARKGSP